MLARRFEPGDLEEVNGWLTNRGLGCADLKMLPHNGFIVPSVAVGFLYKTDSTAAFLDFFVSNKEIPYEKRQEAFDMIAERLIARAIELGFHTVIGTTSSTGMMKRCEKFGFKLQDVQRVYILEC